ncbi:uncharacterized protein Pyn_35684 [Prunus yedoensis var. nudiflora]|uniref:DUF4220 domain-containing protein n=1 Tax=Prunus yedoensis var. nudiflora TaxID=2094558 RepID=A0A314ZG31_PRUYE|nr:uncharacterized protein Pyn_35684 [Prunus yedoensis var. nudiflora]
MLLTALSSWVFVEKRRLIDVFPEPVQKLWNHWELRVMVLISLTLQISLIHFGSRRKYNVKTKIRVFLWFAYLMADWVATVALGVLSQNQGKSSSCDAKGGSPGGNKQDDELSAFWAPFLLLHLGGPDTITAYALEDNELWLRHLLGLAVQVGVALYIFLMAWKTSWLSILTIPMLLSGLIKYGERTLALRSANREKFRDSMLTRPDPGPNYAKFMEEFSLKKAEGYKVSAEDVEVQVGVDEVHVADVCSNSEPSIVVKSHDLFNTFKRLYVDLILSFEDRDGSQIFFQKLGSSETAFKVVEVELGYAYDVFYTKAPIIYTRRGCFFRTVTFSSTCLVFVLFLINVRHKHALTDLIITYILLVGAIILEIYALVLVISSDWTTLWLSKTSWYGKTPSSQPPGIRRTLSSQVTSVVQRAKRQRWSNSTAQFNLLSFCLKTKPSIRRESPKSVCMQKVLEMKLYKFLNQISAYLKQWLFSHILHKLDEKLEMFLYFTREPISNELKELIFHHFLQKSQTKGKLTELCAGRGDLVLDQFKFPDFMTWTTEVEFDQSILLWHIATDLCHHSDATKTSATEYLHREVSMQIADYMMYLLVMCPFMLPIGIGLIRFQDTCAEAKEYFEQRNRTSSVKTEACEMLLRVSTEVKPAKVKGDRSKSVLFDACSLASSLNNQKEKKWEILSQVWIEILGYAASHCRGNFHAQQLRRGGELLSHVWLLMAHLGITEQLQISQGHARVKLIVK